MTASADHTEQDNGAPKPRRSRLVNVLLGLVALSILGAIAAVVGLVLALQHYGRSLPDYTQLADYEPPVVTRIHAGDGSLIEEYARERRLFVPISAIPRPLIEAFLSAEDQNFYDHGGLDFKGILRATITNVQNALSGRRLVGASTITQQVAKNFLLTSEVSFDRKIKEAILAYRIERAFTKDEILELYLNEIYLGFRSYGVAAASLNYFDKALDELTLDEMAYLAALPKAPNNYHPVRRTEAAVGRRDWVLSRMLDDGHITEARFDAARKMPLETRRPVSTRIFRADYFSEEVRRELYRVYGVQGLYEAGLSVRTTLDPRLQTIAERALKGGLIAYDRRHGWRGPIARLPEADDVDPPEWSKSAWAGSTWIRQLQDMELEPGVDAWRVAAVLAVDDALVRIGLEDGRVGVIPFEELRWARRWMSGQRVGGPISVAGDVLEVGDVVAVEELAPEASEPEPGEATENGNNDRVFALRQRPDVGGAVVAMDPHTGRVLAMVGGFSYADSEYNRATQANRQPGSAFKPFVYAAALEVGFTPSSLILDAPFVIDQGMGQGRWKPSNYTDRFYGPSTLRLGLEQSRNLMTVRLANYIGMERISDVADRFSIQDRMPDTLAHALGAGETTLMRLTTAYAELVNGGKDIVPTLVDRIQDRRGKTLYAHDTRPCTACQPLQWSGQAPPKLPDNRAQVIDPANAYQIVSMLEGAVIRGTGRSISTIGKPLAGKTGTTNESHDAWFVGFSPDLVVGVFVGFDRPRTLGPREQGASAAAPIFRSFMEEALKHQPGIPFRVPSGVNLVRVNAETGLPAGAADRQTILEAFVPGTEPSAANQIVLDDPDNIIDGGNTLRVGTGGLY
ncbi:MAG: penicillin-binding protein 1A [Sphingomonadales bacterium]